MLIRNCRLIIDGNEEIRDILAENGKIAAIEKNIEGNYENVIDACGNYVLPGIIDPHVHMRDPGMTHKEDFTTGSMACAKGGITLFFDMPNTVPNIITKEALEDKKKEMKNKSYVDYAFWFGGSRADNHEAVKSVQNEVIGTKVFMNVSTGNMLVEDEKVLESIFRNSKLVGVHAEGEMVKKAIELSERCDVPVYLCHLSTKEEVEYVREAKKKGLKVYGEATPHHLFLNVEDVEKNPLLRMKPELKTKEDNEALWAGIIDGTIDTIGTDSCSSQNRGEKSKTYFRYSGSRKFS